ncbi:MAG TPA: DNA gyrase modulator, partial [Polyangiaceae bacterium]|nr:DNA gyrase modulator [Polyangiaceae bacterium]
MNTPSEAYRAPFAPGGSSGIDADVCRKLLEIALGRGGDYADVFFEYCASGSLSFEEGITRSASRATSLGLGVRVQRGDATGYAYVEDLSWDAMRRAAETAARIAGGTPGASVALSRSSLPDRYALERLTLEVDGREKRALLERASRAALAKDSRIKKVQASFSEEVREVLVATSTGSFAHDVQPLIRFGINVIAEDAGKRESGRSGGGGRMTLGYFDAASPEHHAEE